MRVVKTYNIPDPPKVKCCYCGREFTMSSIWKQLPGEYFEEFVGRLTIQMDMVNDGIPLECGECRPKGTSTF